MLEQVNTLVPTALYLHIPFCRKKCPYCDFFSVEADDHQLRDYVELLCRHIELLQRHDTEPLETVFFGGGTPSLLEDRQVACILDRLREVFGFAAGAEISLEANPGTLDAQKLDGYRQAGINRLSLGVQSLRDPHLRQLGRIHSARQARDAVSEARAAGFDNLNLDLIFNLPGQDLSSFGGELEELLALAPEHLSLYGLSVEEGTEFAARQARGELSQLDEDLATEQYLWLHEQLKQAGFEHYEISNFARPGFRCRHNQSYWRRRGCLAVGCGAHGFIAEGFGSRWAVPPDLERFRRRLERDENPAELLEAFDRQTAMAETLYLALRTCDGLDRNHFLARFGQLPEDAFPRAFQKLQPRLQLESGCWRFDLQGWLLYDHLISQFL